MLLAELCRDLLTVVRLAAPRWALVVAVVRAGVVVVVPARGVRAVVDAWLMVLASRAAACSGVVSVARPGLVGVVRPDDAPDAGVESDMPRRRTGVDVVRVMPDDIDLDADEAVGAA